MNILETITIIIIGWVAGAESGSWMCVHPVIAKLPTEQQIVFQKGLLKTFGRVMPILMPLSLVLMIAVYINNPDKADFSGIIELIATILSGTAILTTVFFNVPVNIITGKWKENNYSKEWIKKRLIWRFFQGYRSIVFLIVFVLLIVNTQTK